MCLDSSASSNDVRLLRDTATANVTPLASGPASAAAASTTPAAPVAPPAPTAPTAPTAPIFLSAQTKMTIKSDVLAKVGGLVAQHQGKGDSK